MPTRQQLENLLHDTDFRRQFVADYVQEMVAAQIRAMRERLGLTQEQIGEAAAGMSQVQVSRLENPDYSGATVNSLKRMAHAFDVGLVVRFVPFSEFIDWVTSQAPERLAPPSYAEEHRLGTKDGQGQSGTSHTICDACLERETRAVLDTMHVLKGVEARREKG